MAIKPNYKVKKHISRLNLRKEGKVACSVLAAGLSLRFGSTKQLARMIVNGKPLIQNAVDTANESRSDYVFVVLGHDSDRIMEELKLGRAQILLNKNYKSGISTSIKTAICNLPSDCSSLVLMTADQPFLTPRIINHLIESLGENPKAKTAALAYKYEPRNPAIFSRATFSLLKQIKGDRGAKEFLIQNSRKGDLILVDVKDPWVFFDIDTSSGLKRASKEHSLRMTK